MDLPTKRRKGLSHRMKKKKVISVVISDLVTDQRVHKFNQTLASLGYDVTVWGLARKHSLPLAKNLAYQAKRFRCWFQKGKLFYIEFQLRLLWILLWHRFDIVQANDLDTLLPAFVVAKLKRKKIIYDSHEYYTEVPELIDRPFTRMIWLTLEKMLVPKLPFALTVNHALANIYQKKYKIPFHAIYNVPYLTEVVPSIEEILARKKILIYQGALNKGRGIELMIKAMSLLFDWELWIIGHGDLAESLKRQAQLHKNVRFMGVIPFQELAAYTNQARIGLSLEEDMGENYRVATPNKVFDYMHACVPMIVSDLPAMSELIHQTQVGFVLHERTPQALVKLILQLHQPEIYAEKVKQCLRARIVYSWQNQMETLKKYYEAT